MFTAVNQMEFFSNEALTKTATQYLQISTSCRLHVKEVYKVHTFQGGRKNVRIFSWQKDKLFMINTLDALIRRTADEASHDRRAPTNSATERTLPSATRHALQFQKRRRRFIIIQLGELRECHLSYVVECASLMNDAVRHFASSSSREFLRVLPYRGFINPLADLQFRSMNMHTTLPPSSKWKCGD